VSNPNIITYIEGYLESCTAFSPTDPDIKWTHCSAFQIQEWLLKTHHIAVYAKCIRRCLKALGYVRRKPSKSIATGKSPFREAQFLVILAFIKLFKGLKGEPMISMDTKKKELVGNLTRNQPVWLLKDDKIDVFDHDYPNLAAERANPHGIYDIKQNIGYMTVGNSAETADFVVDNIEYWWITYGIHNYPDATRLLIFCDGGGANSYRHYRFKYRIQELAKSIGLIITICHYPPYCSKYNPIEHRLFAQIHRTMNGSHFLTLEHFQDCIEHTTTKTGLYIHVRIVRKVYERGRESTPELLDEKHYKPAQNLPQFNYAFYP
jgi:Rhodopirellula transposase DDE domain